MRIEEGKFYRTRDGRKVGPMKRPFSGVSEYAWAGDYKYSDETYGGIWYRSEGGLMHPDAPNGGDIISEWTDEPTSPVRTVISKQIVAGVYGRLSIRPYSTEKRILIALANMEGSIGDAVHHGWTLDELHAAIATLTEIADALGEAP